MAKRTSKPKRTPASAPYAPPGHLSATSKALWANVVPRRARSPERLALLCTALESLDRAEACRKQIEAEGMVSVTPGTGMAHVHPLLKIEKEARQIFLRAWGALRLEWCPLTDGIVMPGETGVAADTAAEYAAMREEVMAARPGDEPQPREVKETEQ